MPAGAPIFAVWTACVSFQARDTDGHGLVAILTNYSLRACGKFNLLFDCHLAYLTYEIIVDFTALGIAWVISFTG